MNNESKNNVPAFDAVTLVGLACRLGSSKALEFVEFEAATQELSPQQRKLLLRGWLAVEWMPHDASLEASDLHKCLTALRQAWIHICHLDEKLYENRKQMSHVQTAGAGRVPVANPDSSE